MDMIKVYINTNSNKYYLIAFLDSISDEYKIKQTLLDANKAYQQAINELSNGRSKYLNNDVSEVIIEVFEAVTDDSYKKYLKDNNEFILDDKSFKIIELLNDGYYIPNYIIKTYIYNANDQTIKSIVSIDHNSYLKRHLIHSEMLLAYDYTKKVTNDNESVLEENDSYYRYDVLYIEEHGILDE